MSRIVPAPSAPGEPEKGNEATAPLLTLPDPTVVHPGHGPATTIGRERRSNPFLAGAAV